MTPIEAVLGYATCVFCVAFLQGLVHEDLSKAYNDTPGPFFGIFFAPVGLLAYLSLGFMWVGANCRKKLTFHPGD